MAAAAVLREGAKEKWCMEAQHREEDAVARESTLPAAEIISVPCVKTPIDWFTCW